MATAFTRSAGVWNSERGEFISEAHARLADALFDYNRGFSLVYIPEKNRSAEDTKPFAILHSPDGKEPYIIRYLTAEAVNNVEEVLGWVFENDLSKNSGVLQKIEARERAKKVLQLQEQEDQLAELRDIAMHAARSPLHKYKINDQTTIRG